MCTCAADPSGARRPGPSRTTVRQVKRLSRDRKSVSEPSVETLWCPPCTRTCNVVVTRERPCASGLSLSRPLYLNTSRRRVFAGVTGLTKPVPPPKPAKSPQNHHQQQLQQQQQQTPGPPPYRMPPYPLYNESTPLPGTSNKIHTHSSKFPVSRTQYVFFYFFRYYY